MLLHIINKSPLGYSALTDALPLIGKNDTVLFIDDGVYASCIHNNLIQELIAKGCTIAVLKNDMQIRGLGSDHQQFKLLEMPDFVQLVFNSNKSVSWY